MTDLLKKGLDHVVKVENDRLSNQNFHTLRVTKEVSLTKGPHWSKKLSLNKLSASDCSLS